MKKVLLLSASLLLIGLHAFAGAPLVAFPGAEGFGKNAVGGRGGKVVAVTNLDDYKTTEPVIEGSLRWALSQFVRTDSVDRVYVAAGGGDSIVKKAITVFTPLTVVFKVSGTIWLKEDLKVKRDSLTIAGQTAPGDGICIAGRSVLFNGATGAEMFYYGPRRTDLIVRYIRFRPGIPRDASGVPTSSFVTYGCDVENYKNVIFDHCTMGWANEECLATYDTKNVTVQWCLVAEGLYNAYHIKGTRAYGGVWGGQFASFHHNLIAHQNSRTVRFNGSRAHDTIAVVEYRNNVIYNWGNSDCASGGEIYDPLDKASDRQFTDSLGVLRYSPTIRTLMTSSTGKTYYVATGKSETNIINNYYKGGAATPTDQKGYRIIILNDRYEASFPNKERGQIYADGNVVVGNSAVSTDNWNGGIQLKTYPIGMLSTFKLNTPSTEIVPVLPVTLQSATDAYAQVLNSAGACLPFRDAHDKRIMLEVQNGTVSGTGSFGANKGIIDNPSVLGGWPIFTTGNVLTDTDKDGMPDSFENDNGLNPSDSIDGNSLAPSGYTWLEEYLNSIVSTDDFLQAPFHLKAVLNAQSKPSLSWQDVSDLEENYVIERAPFGTTDFVAIDTVAGNVTTLVDSTANGATYTYRVKAITATLQSAYCDTISLSVPVGLLENKIKKLQVYPIPVVNTLTIEAEETLVSVEVYTLAGVLVEKLAVDAKKVLLPMNSYPQGNYTLKLTSKAGATESIKLIK